MTGKCDELFCHSKLILMITAVHWWLRVDVRLLNIGCTLTAFQNLDSFYRLIMWHVVIVIPDRTCGEKPWNTTLSQRDAVLTSHQPLLSLFLYFFPVSWVLHLFLKRQCQLSFWLFALFCFVFFAEEHKNYNLVSSSCSVNLMLHKSQRYVVVSAPCWCL